MKQQNKNLQEQLIKIGLKIAREGKGGLYVVGKADYQVLVNNKSVEAYNAFDDEKMVESFAYVDGAVILDEKGNVEAVGAMIKQNGIIKGNGTRHAGAVSASKTADYVVLISQEERKVKILKKGKLVMQIDALEKNVEKSVPKALQVFNSVVDVTAITVGTSIAAPIVGITFLPGVIIFGSAYYILKQFGGKI